MATRGPVPDDIAKLLTNAAGFARGMRREAETIADSRFERWLAQHDVPTREELEAVRETARRAREEADALRARVEALEAATADPKSTTDPAPAADA